MNYVVIILFGIIVAAAIYWIMDWQSHHEDGE